MKKEHELVLKAVIINKNEEEIGYLDNLINSDIDWFEVAGILVNHRLSGYFYMGLNEQQKKKIPKELRKILELLIKAQKEQQENNNVELLNICKVLLKKEVRFAALKGAFFGCDMYEQGLRRSNDLDLLVYEQDLEWRYMIFSRIILNPLILKMKR